MGLVASVWPAIDLAHVYRAGGKQGPEQHGRGVRRWQQGLRLDASLELFVQPLDRVGGASAAPLTWRQPGKGEEPVAGFLQALGNGAVLEPPFVEEGLAARRDLLTRRRVDHVVVIGGDLIVQTLGCVRQQVPVLVDRAALDRYAVPDGGDRVLEPRRAIDDEELGTAQTPPERDRRAPHARLQCFRRPCS